MLSRLLLLLCVLAGIEVPSSVLQACGTAWVVFPTAGKVVAPGCAAAAPHRYVIAVEDCCSCSSALELRPIHTANTVCTASAVPREVLLLHWALALIHRVGQGQVQTAPLLHGLRCGHALAGWRGLGAQKPLCGAGQSWPTVRALGGARLLRRHSTCWQGNSFWDCW